WPPRHGRRWSGPGGGCVALEGVGGVCVAEPLRRNPGFEARASGGVLHKAKIADGSMWRPPR
ncbi:MAG: hypothetical protein M3069_24625, partial [Chloroflexota bacterium]|nr:hypothetical protein [Chloroflexota bacterium]